MFSQILIIDDDADLREVLKDILTSQGYRCSLAANGKEAEKILNRHKPDLIILDMQLPDINGFELCQLIRRKYSASELPIIALSGRFLETDDKVEGLELGVDEYFCKPFDPKELLARIINLQKKQHKAEGSAPNG